MKLRPLSAGFIPLVDAAPLIVAKELGFAEEEGLALDLVSAPSWSTLRDMLAFGQIQAAHMLSPVPVASALGLMNGIPRLNALMVLSVNGTVFGISESIAQRLENTSFAFDFSGAQAAGRALAELKTPLRVGVPFILSMHHELVSLWLTRSGMVAGEDFQICAVPPPMMAQAVKNGDLDAFCVGEPWGSVTVERASGILLVPGSAIWSSAPEKVLAVREDWAEKHPDETARLMRATWRAAEWLGRKGNSAMAAEFMAVDRYLGLGPDIIERALTGELIVNSQGDLRKTPDFLRLHGSDTCFPWQSKAAWIGESLAQRYGLDSHSSKTFAESVFRSDLFRENLADLGAAMPQLSDNARDAAEDKRTDEDVSEKLILAPNRFFDGTKYGPNR